MEHYGTKPKKFTAAWFDYVWEYYKIHIIVTLLIIAAVIYTWYAIASAPHYDMEACMSLSAAITDEETETLKNELGTVIADIDDNDDIKIKISDCSVPQNYEDAEYSQSMEAKFYLSLLSDDVYLVIASESMVKRLTNDESMDGLFEEAVKWSGTDGEYTYFAYAGDSEVLRRAGVQTEDIYIGIKNFIGGDGDEKNTAKRDNALCAAKYILGSM